MSVTSALPHHSREERRTPGCSEVTHALQLSFFLKHLGFCLCVPWRSENNLQESLLPLHGVQVFLFVLRQPWVAWNLLCKPGMWRRYTCLCVLSVCCHALWALGIELRLSGLAVRHLDPLRHLVSPLEHLLYVPSTLGFKSWWSGWRGGDALGCFIPYSQSLIFGSLLCGFCELPA